MRKGKLIVLFALLLVASERATAHAQFEVLIMQMLQQASSTQAVTSDSSSSGQNAVNQATNNLSTVSYSFNNGRGVQSPSTLMSTKTGNCVDTAIYFADTLSNMGLQTEVIGESYKLPDGSVHNAPNDGHFIGIATDGVHAWANSNKVVKMFSSVDAAVAWGGVGADLPSGTTVFNQRALSGNYSDFVGQVNSGRINW